MHWAHGVEDTDAVDVVGYSYLFHSLAMGIWYNQLKCSRHVSKRTSQWEGLMKGTLKKKHQRKKGPCNNNNNHKYKYQ